LNFTHRILNARSPRADLDWPPMLTSDRDNESSSDPSPGWRRAPGTLAFPRLQRRKDDRRTKPRARDEGFCFRVSPRSILSDHTRKACRFLIGQLALRQWRRHPDKPPCPCFCVHSLN
jgi:hypothetical protein